MSDADQGSGVQTIDAWVPSWDGTELACRVWEPVGGLTPGRPIAVLHHGVAFYGAAYDGLGRFLAERGVPLCAPDARGHGRSGGQRGDMRNGRTMLHDLHAMVCWARRRYPGHPLLLIGESMGGLFTLNYAALFGQPSGNVAALLLVAPGLLIHPRQIAHFTVVRHTPHARRADEAQGEAMRAWRTALAGSRDPDWLQAHDQDPLVLPSVSARYMMIVTAMGMRTPVAAQRWTRPTLILHGKRDGVVPYHASVMLYHMLRARDKELVLFPNIWHTMFWDPDTPAVLTRIESWLSSHFAPEGRLPAA